MTRALLAAATLLAGAAAAQGYCPCYTASSVNNTYDCAIEAAPGTNPTVAQWQAIFHLVAQGPSVWGSAGPSVSNIGQGCGLPNPTTSVPAKFPCELLKAIAYQESGWKQFCVPDRPSDQVGGASRTIISFDCGYGIGQVTSGMHVGENPSFDRNRVASDATYNLATGTQILASKWRATECVGDNQPSIIEHWYSATWAYNGLAYSNNPNNPNYSSTRGIYNPSVGGSRPYQEKVFGWMEYPPTTGHWSSTRFAYPRLSDIPGTGGSPGQLPEPTCGSPTSCATTRTRNVSSCFQQGADAGTGGGGGATGGGGGATGGGSGTGGGSATGGGSGTGGGAPSGGGGGSATGGGAGSDAGPGGGGGADDAGAPTEDAGAADAGLRQPLELVQGGCGCGAVPPLVPLALALALLTRRRR